MNVVVNLDDLIYELQRNQRKQLQARESPGINTFSESTTELNGHFVNFLLLIDVFTRMKIDREDKELLVRYLRTNVSTLMGEKKKSVYSTKEKKELENLTKVINNFERSYSPETAIYWYSSPTFLFTMLNKALRDLNIEMLLLFRFFIVDIYKQLLKGSQSQSAVEVFRGQFMSEEEINRLRSSRNRLISINAFFSTSKTKAKALEFINHRHEEEHHEHCHHVLFTIKADSPFTSNTVFADIAKLAYFDYEKEVLFMVGSIFRLKTVEKTNENGGIWKVEMQLCGDNENELKKLFEHKKKEYGGGNDTATILTLANVLREMGEYDVAEKYYNRLRHELSPNDPSLPDFYKSLGIFYTKKDYFNDGLRCFETALKIYTQSKSCHYSGKADLYNWIGEMYRFKNENDMALKYYDNAVEIFQDAHDEENQLLTHIYLNIATVHTRLKQYSKALKYQEKSLRINKKFLPRNHPDIAASYNNMANVYVFLETYDQALDYYLQSLEIREKCLPPYHPDIAHSNRNIGLVYERLSDWESAKTFYEKAENSFKHSLPTNHPLMIQLKRDLEFVSSKAKIGQVESKTG